MSNISCILYPPTLDYHYLVQRPQQLMKNFSELNIPTYYLNNPSPHSLTGHGVEKLNEYFYLFNQVDPAPYLQGLNPVVYYTSAAQADSIGKYNPSLVVFDSVDEPSGEFEAWRPYYDNAVRSADVVLTTSGKLFNLASTINPNVYLVPNGCDYDHFANFIHGRPAEIAHLTGPIIGYIGVVATWVDVELIARVADSYPDCNIVVVGPLYNVSEVPDRPNIHWLGFKPYEQLPAFAQSFDVGLIPFKASSMTEAVNPIKMWEYMATGMPIVTTNLPEARKYSDYVFIAATDEEFIFQVGQAIAEDAPEKRQNRMALAFENSWRVRASIIIGIIEEQLALKGIQTSVPIPAVGDGLAALPAQEVSSSDGYIYSGGRSSKALVRIYGAHRVLKIGRRNVLKISRRSIGKGSVRSKTVRGRVPTHPQIRIVGGAKFRFDTGRKFGRCVC
ncbi:MAG TPA: glycosyltransferase [Syntrophomonadaceae bacterium]|nr:glycosyltransferase [Syntrophomonadaceae bacterium]